MAPPRCAGVIGQQAEGFTFDTDKGGDQPRGKLPAQLQHAAGVGEGGNHLANVIDAQTVFRNEVAQLALIGAAPLA